MKASTWSISTLLRSLSVELVKVTARSPAKTETCQSRSSVWSCLGANFTGGSRLKKVSNFPLVSRSSVASSRLSLSWCSSRLLLDQTWERTRGKERDSSIAEIAIATPIKSSALPRSSWTQGPEVDEIPLTSPADRDVVFTGGSRRSFTGWPRRSFIGASTRIETTSSTRIFGSLVGTSKAKLHLGSRKLRAFTCYHRSPLPQSRLPSWRNKRLWYFFFFFLFFDFFMLREWKRKESILILDLFFFFF